jgi:hypothetical protein
MLSPIKSNFLSKIMRRLLDAIVNGTDVRDIMTLSNLEIVAFISNMVAEIKV